MRPQADLVLHIKLGVPAAATAHALVRFICEALPLRQLWFLPVYALLGVVFGSIVLVPAVVAQTLLIRRLSARRVPIGVSALTAGLLQAAFVWLFDRLIGLEPTWKLRIAVTPLMMLAAFLVGSLVACAVAVRLSLPAKQTT